MEPKIRCRQCKQQLWATWFSRSIRCQFCDAVTLIRTSEHSGNGQLEAMDNGRNNMSTGSGSSHVSKITYEASHPASTDQLSQITKLGPMIKGSPEEGGRKRALLCGVSYEKQPKYKLQGTINDVENMRKLLIDFYGFPKEFIRVLTEKEGNDSRIPTRTNIEESLKWLVEGCQSGDSLVFFFSGHGLRQFDFDGDEIDGFDETICPVDFTENGMIVDNYINSTIVRPLPKGVTLHAIVDACHSGTILDLPHVYNYEGKKWENNSPPSGAFKGTSGGLAISLSACEDDERATDTSALSGKMNGAMTYCFFQAILKDRKLTYGQLLGQIHEAIYKANRKKYLHSRFLMRLFRSRLIKDPQLSSSEEFDINKKEFKL